MPTFPPFIVSKHSGKGTGKVNRDYGLSGQMGSSVTAKPTILYLAELWELGVDHPCELSMYCLES